MNKKSRRNILKGLVVAAPVAWAKPVVDSVFLPAHGATSICDVVLENVATVNPSCHGGNDGSIIVTASGGTAPLTYSNDNGVTFQAGTNFTDLIAGTYDIIIEDATGCQATTIVTLTDKDLVNGILGAANPSFFGAVDGSISIIGNGGDGGPYSYSIDNGVTFQFSGIFTGLVAATYDIIIEDAGGCQATTQISLTDTDFITFDVARVNPSCNGGNDGSIVVTASGGDVPLTYSIDNGVTFQADNNFTGLVAAFYDIVVEDVNGYQATTRVRLRDNDIVGFTAGVGIPSSAGDLGSISIAGNGGDGGPYVYSIDNGVTFTPSGSFPGLVAATYDIVIEDASGCQATTQITLTNRF